MKPNLQSLPPAQAKFCLNVEKLCLRLLPQKKDPHFLLAVSGGRDSMALALVFKILSMRMGATLSSMHINHRLRPAAALDARFVQTAMQGLEIPHKTVENDVETFSREAKIGLEEAGRNVRYQLLEDFRKQIGADFILTGHHLGDLGEDVIMRLLRGAAWPALGGMGYINKNIFRPFLHESRERLTSLLTAAGLGWREDESNQKLAFRRNRIRHLLMPMLRCENPSFETSLARLHSQAETDRDYWQSQINGALSLHPWQILRENDTLFLRLPNRLLRDMHPALRMRLFNYALSCFREMHNLGGQNSAHIISGMEHMFCSRDGGKILECGDNIRARYAKGNMDIFAQISKGSDSQLPEAQ